MATFTETTSNATAAALTANTGNVVLALKKISDDRVWNQLSEGNFLFNLLLRGKGEQVNARNRDIPMRVGRSGIGSFPGEGEGIGYASPEEFIRCSFGYTKYVKPFSFTPEARSNMNSPSSLRSLTEMFDQYRKDIETELSRFAYGNGSGAVAVVRGAATGRDSTDIAEDHGNGILGLPFDPITTETAAAVSAQGGVGSRMTADIDFNSIYQLIKASDLSIRATGTATRLKALRAGFTESQARFQVVDASGASVTAALANTLAEDVITEGDLLVPVGTYKDNVSRAMHGLAYHMPLAADTTYQNMIDQSNTSVGPDDYPETRAVAYNANLADLTLAICNYIEDSSRFRRDDEEMGGTDKDVILTGIGQHRRVKQLIGTHRRADMSERTMVTGGKDVESQFGNKWKTDKYCPDDRLLHIHVPDLALLVLEKLQFIDPGNGGNMWLRQSGDDFLHLYDGAWFMLWEMIGRCPKNQGLVYSLSIKNIMRAAGHIRTHA